MTEYIINIIKLEAMINRRFIDPDNKTIENTHVSYQNYLTINLFSVHVIMSRPKLLTVVYIDKFFNSETKI